MGIFIGEEAPLNMVTYVEWLSSRTGYWAFWDISTAAQIRLARGYATGDIKNINVFSSISISLDLPITTGSIVPLLALGIGTIQLSIPKTTGRIIPLVPFSSIYSQLKGGNIVGTLSKVIGTSSISSLLSVSKADVDIIGIVAISKVNVVLGNINASCNTIYLSAMSSGGINVVMPINNIICSVKGMVGTVTGQAFNTTISLAKASGTIAHLVGAVSGGVFAGYPNASFESALGTSLSETNWNTEFEYTNYYSMPYGFADRTTAVAYAGVYSVNLTGDKAYSSQAMADPYWDVDNDQWITRDPDMQVNCPKLRLKLPKSAFASSRNLLFNFRLASINPTFDILYVNLSVYDSNDIKVGERCWPICGNNGWNDIVIGGYLSSGASYITPANLDTWYQASVDIGTVQYNSGKSVNDAVYGIFNIIAYSDALLGYGFTVYIDNVR
jgi:hypothetical protein